VNYAETGHIIIVISLTGFLQLFVSVLISSYLAYFL